MSLGSRRHLVGKQGIWAELSMVDHVQKNL